MITVSDIQRFDGLDFANYQALPHYNFSFLKREKFGIAQSVQVTDKMILGTLVDAIRTGGKVDMSHKLYPHAKKIAAFLYAKFPAILDALVPQVSFTGNMLYSGFRLPVKGRPDYLLPKKLIIDLKIMHGRDIPSTISYMRYEDQQFGYAKLAQVSQAYILAYSVPLQDAKFYPLQINDSNPFWIEKIIKFGKPL